MEMNDAGFEANMKVHCKQVPAAVNAFSPNNITSDLDQDELHANLRRVKDKFLQVTDRMDALIMELEENNESARIAGLEAMTAGVKKVMNHDQRTVKKKMEKTIADDLATRLPTPAEKKVIRMLEEKMKIRKTFIEEKCSNLCSVIESFKEPSEMTNDEARFAIKESKDWERKFDKIINLQQMYFEGSVTLDNEVDRQNVQAVVDNLCLAINSKVNSLFEEDEK